MPSELRTPPHIACSTISMLLALSTSNSVLTIKTNHAIRRSHTFPCMSGWIAVVRSADARNRSKLPRAFALVYSSEMNFLVSFSLYT
ncbi:hypothetical protein F5Y09DRAFT_313003 [Xylaria sp. FL1042]|nr:hypothetical protein F5Y09DRAFT_313003 [Xylaria sp. FL1042]